MSSLAVSLPSELKRYIASFCSPAELATLARIHSSYQADAETILYNHIEFFMKPENHSILDTLKSNGDKASLVHSMTVEFRKDWDYENEAGIRASDILCDVLSNMCALTELRLHYVPLDVDFQRQLENILCDGFFKLDKLHCSVHLDITKIISSQSESLQVLGLHSNGDMHRVLKVFEDINAAPETCGELAFFTFEREHFVNVFNVLTVFPTFSEDSDFSWLPIFESYDSERPFSRLEVTWVCIHLENPPEVELFTNLLEEMLGHFSSVTTFDFRFRHEAEEAEMLLSPHVDSILVNILGAETLEGWPVGFDVTFGPWSGDEDLRGF